MIVKTIFAGFGGQGVLMMGYSLAHAAMNQGYFVTFLPSYGAEMRGGTANCTVAVGDEEIASPIASEPEYLVVMNAPSMFAFQNRLEEGGAMFLNSSIIKARPTRMEIEVLEVPCTEMAEREQNPRGANMVMLGAFIARTGMVDPEVYMKSMETILGGRKKSVLDANRKAFEAGFRFMKNPA